MSLTAKDLQIINEALAQYEALLEDEDETNLARTFHAEKFGNPDKTVEATRRRVGEEIQKRATGNTRRARAKARAAIETEIRNVHLQGGQK